MFSMVSPARATAKLIVYLAFSLVMIPMHILARLLRLPGRDAVIPWYHRQTCRIAGLRVVERGTRRPEAPTLFVCNHVSYFDIAILGALIQGSFVAKAEIASWPFFGLLAKLQRTVFIERRSRRAVAHRNEMLERLEAGENLILFPEGTSGDGNAVLPFKSSLFAVAELPLEDGHVVVQPVSIAYTKLDGLPLGRYFRPFFAWYGDMDLMSHLWRALGLGPCTVVVEFHPPVSIAAFGSRKALGDHCQRVVAAGVTAAITGRPTSYPEQLEPVAA